MNYVVEIDKEESRNQVLDLLPEEDEEEIIIVEEEIEIKTKEETEDEK